MPSKTTFALMLGAILLGGFVGTISAVITMAMVAP